MIELIEGLRGPIVGCIAKGVVTATDYEDVLLPAIHRALEKHPLLRCYFELGAGFSGMDPDTLWQDYRLTVEHRARWERLAVVTDQDWITHAVNAFCFLLPGPARVFSMDEKSTARNWIAADDQQAERLSA